VIPDPARPVRIGNCSGFFGDRLSAAAELVASGEIDVLTGDWLAELTMLILARQRMSRGTGYARTFLTQMEQVLGTCLDRGIRVVSNAGGLDPMGCGQALAELSARLGLSPRIGVITGDDVVEVVGNAPDRFPNLDTGEPLGTRKVITANAYLGGWPVTAALHAGAQVVVAGRITDAALVVGPAAWWHGWSYGAAADARGLDRLAGAVVAGHVIECGAQATGGNYCFFEEVPGWPAGFPIAEVASDGSSVITKPSGSGGLVSPGTVTAQLLYELAGPRYANPDVTARFDTIEVSSTGPDRVAIRGARGEPPPGRLKVAVNLLSGYRNSVSLVLTGTRPRDKADLALRLVAGVGLDEALGDPASGQPPADPADLARASNLAVESLHVALDDVAREDPATTALAQGHLRITVKDSQQGRVGKPFTTAIVESALSSYPGMFPTAPPADATPYGLYWPTLVDRSEVAVAVTVGGRLVSLGPDPTSGVAAGSGGGPAGSGGGGKDVDPAPGEAPCSPGDPPEWAPGPGTLLGDIVGARSGDKGGNANVGFWVPEAGVGPSRDVDDAGTLARYRWLVAWLTPDRVRALLPEATGLPVDVHPLPNLRAVNVVIRGLLGRGVSGSTSLDPQAKGLAEHLRARVVQVSAPR
jgi:hypothetical protein